MSSHSKYRISELIDGSLIDQPIQVQGWVRNKRESKNVVFVSLNDGSTIQNLQIVGDPQLIGESLLKKINSGASITATGTLRASQGKGQKIELGHQLWAQNPQ